MAMKIDEAIADFKNWNDMGFSKAETPSSEHIVMAIKALEKQIQQKVVPVGSYGRFCPVCDEQVFVSIAKYCCFCGQALLQEVE